MPVFDPLAKVLRVDVVRADQYPIAFFGEIRKYMFLDKLFLFFARNTEK